MIAEEIAGLKSKTIRAIAWNSVDTILGSQLLFNVGKKFSFIGVPKLNNWQNRDSVDFVIEDAIML